MLVYSESNFVLELALQQEQHEACEKLVAAAEHGRCALAIPAFCRAEPYTTVIRRRQARQRLSEQLTMELGQLARSKALAEQVDAHRSLSATLLGAGEPELDALRRLIIRMLKAIHAIPLDASTLERALAIEERFGLDILDAVVLASVLAHLETRSPEAAVFLNRNTKDFDDPEIVKELNDRHCKLITHFNEALNHIRLV